MPETHEVYSSVVAEIGYDPATKTLLVRWQRGGKMSTYKNVPEDVAVKVMNSPSIGSALRESIQSGYEHEYIPENE